MSLQWELNRQIPEDTARLGQAILRADNTYRRIGDFFDDLFPSEEVFADLYESSGRGAIPPLLLELVTVFQMLEGVPDRVAAEWVVSRIDWKYALHLPLDYAGFHFTDLYAFRQRLLAHGRERWLLDELLVKLKGMGLIKQRGKVRTDSSHMLGVVERLSQLELVTESIRVALRVVGLVEPEWVDKHVPASFREVYERRQSEYGLSEREVTDRLVKAGKDGFWFLAQVEHSELRTIQELAEVKTLRTVLQQQFPSGSGKPPAPTRPSGGETIESPHETQARRSTKRGNSWIGYKFQVSESCDEDRPHLIVDIDVTPATANDCPELPKIQTRLKERDLLPGEQQVDQGYMSGKRLAESQALGIKLMGIPLNDTQGPQGFRQADFAIDEVAHQATCPAGHTNVVWSEKQAEDEPAPSISIRFDAITCQQCSNFGICTNCRQGRSLTLHPYRQLLNQQRDQAQSEDFKQKLHLRAGIEGTVSELVRAHGLRRARYRGLPKTRLQACFTAVATDLKRLARWLARSQSSQALSAAPATLPANSSLDRHSGFSRLLLSLFCF